MNVLRSSLIYQVFVMLPCKKKSPGHPRSKSAPPTIRSTLTKLKRMQWSNEAVSSAMEAVKSGQSVFRAALTYGVPKSTLHDRISGRSIHGKKPGPDPYLTSTEEKSLSEFLKEVASVGYGKSRSDIIKITEQVLKDKGKAPKGTSSEVISGWLKRFLERSPELTL